MINNKMTLSELENEVIDCQNTLIAKYSILDELWSYHPLNEKFINPITSYEELKKEIISMEVKMAEIEQKIKHIKSVN
jgi:uncharacterized coiled-coil DUF342 family protein